MTVAVAGCGSDKQLAAYKGLMPPQLIRLDNVVSDARHSINEFENGQKSFGATETDMESDRTRLSRVKDSLALVIAPKKFIAVHQQLVSGIRDLIDALSSYDDYLSNSVSCSSDAQTYAQSVPDDLNIEGYV